MINWKTLEEKPYAPLAAQSRKIAADGCVLLKNEDNLLPIKEGHTVSLFGRTQIDYIKSGTGSGGLVNTEYTVNIIDGIRANGKIKLNTELLDIYKNWIKNHPFDSGSGWATEPWCQLEMVPDETVVKTARTKSDVAVIIIGRTAGEDKDNTALPGSWYLTDEEHALLDIISKHFSDTVVLLNVGNIIDMSWVEQYNIKSVLYIWQGGQEGGNAAADILCGDVTPSGKLADTIARHISDYPCSNHFGDPACNIYQEDIYVGYRYFETFAPEKVLYPFGFGLSYTSFDIHTEKISKTNDTISTSVTVTNTGDRSGKEVVQIYFEAPQGKLGKSRRVLCAFQKTKLLAPKEQERISFAIKLSDMASYDDSGITGNKACYVLEAGEYHIYIGNCVRCAEKVFTFSTDNLSVTQKCSEALAPERDFHVLYPTKDFKEAYRSVAIRTVDYANRVKNNLPKTIEYTGDKGLKLSDVKQGKAAMEMFVAQLSDLDLKCMITGEGPSSPKTRPGCVGAFGGVTPSLASFGIPVVCLADGPSGIRMDNGDAATGMPNGTLIGCTWDISAAEKLYEYASIELCTHHIDSLLGPGINIHRSPLNGRNFEYISEDPYLTGKIGAALIRGMNVYGNAATVKHFAANSQEFCRRDVVSAVSERALREIYLKGFELAVKEGGAKSIMTSYNPINEHWTALNYELNTVILREEWGYTGFVMTDWWPKLSKTEDEKQNLREMAEAQNDVFMLTTDALKIKDNIMESLENRTLTRGQLQRNVINLLTYIITTHSFERFMEDNGSLAASLKDRIDTLKTVFEWNEPQNNQIMDIDYPKTGKHLLRIDYTADAPEISQLVITASINDTMTFSSTVCGTNNKSAQTYIDFTTDVTQGTIKLAFPPAISVSRLTVLG